MELPNVSKCRTALLWKTAFFLALLCFCAGCKTDAPQASVRQEAAAVDDSGYALRIERKPQRIVSLNLGTDEILVDLVPSERIAALSHLASDAGLSSIVEKAAAVPVKLTGRNVEAVVAQKPDLVLMADSAPAEVRESLREMGVAVYVSRSPHSLAEAMRRVERIAALVGEEARGREIIADMQEKLAAVAARVDPIPARERKVILALSFSGAFGRADGMFHDMCLRAGAVNGAAKAGLTKDQPLSKEQIVRLNPDVLLLPTWSSDEKDDSEALREEVRCDPAYQTVKAVQENRLVFVSDRYRYCVSQYAADSVAQIARAVYPERFATAVKK